MTRLRRHNALVLLAILLIGGMPVWHSAQHAVEHAQVETPALHAAPSGNAADSASGVAAASEDGEDVAYATVMEQAECDLCAHVLYGTPTATRLTPTEQEAPSHKTRLRSRVVAATPYHFVIRGPPAHV